MLISGSRKAASALLPGERLVLFATCLSLRAISLIRPCLSDDEAIYAVVAREMLRGRVLYRDVVDHKPPLIYVTYAVTQALAGPIGGMRVLHLLTVLVVFATALLLADLCHRVLPAGDERSPFVAALLYVLFTTTLFDFDSLAANCELFMMLPLVGSLNLYVRAVAGEVSVPLLAASGALVSAAMFYKYQAAVQLPLYFAHLLTIGHDRRVKVKDGLLAIAAGVLAPSALGALILAGHGALSSAWFWFKFNFAYIREGLAPGELFRRALLRVSFVVGIASFLWWLGLREALRRLAKRGDRDPIERSSALILGWLALSLAAIAAGGRFFGHYFHQATAPLAVLAAPSAVALWRRSPRVVAAWVGGPVVVFFVLGAAHKPVLAALGEPDTDYGTIVRYVIAHSAPTDSVVVWGNSPVLSFEANRALGSRFVFSNYMTGLSPATQTQSDPNADASANIVPESWDMFERDLSVRKPALFVDLSAGNIDGYAKFPPSRFPRLSTILERDYELLGKVAGSCVWRRKDTAPPSPPSGKAL